MTKPANKSDAAAPPEAAKPSAVDQPPALDRPPRIRYRIRFAKTGLLRWTSHRDLARLWERLLRRGMLKLSMTEGFHPKPRVSFPTALALGSESLDEVVEIDLAEEISAEQLLRRLTGDAQPGLTIGDVKKLPDGFGKARIDSTVYAITFPDMIEVRVEDVDAAIERLLARSTVTVTRKDKPLTLTTAEQILELRRPEGDQRNLSGAIDGVDQHLHLIMSHLDGASLKPADVLDLLGFSTWTENGARIIRTRVRLTNEFDIPTQSDSSDQSEKNSTNPSGDKRT